MASSLQEQLLKAGLVSEADLNRSKKKDHKGRRRSGGKRPESAARADAKRKSDAKAARDRAENAKLEAERKEKALRHQIRELVLGGSMNDDKADVPYNVVKNGRIRRIYVTPAQRDALAAGTLAVTTARGRHHVVSAEVADKVQTLIPDFFVFRARDAAASGDAAGEDDAYAGYEVPDDLMW